MKGDNCQNRVNDSAAIQMLTTDMLENILANADNPGALSMYLTRQMRELLGGKIVALIECECECVAAASRHRIVNVFPERHKSAIDCAEINELAALAHDYVRAQLWGGEAGPERARVILKEKGWGDTIMLPLTFGRKRFGVIFVFGLMDLNNVSSLLKTLETLTHIIALVLKNSLQFENLENIIAERTAEISEKERQFRTLAAASPVGIVTLDAKGVITFANGQAEKILGLSMPSGGGLKYNSPSWRTTDIDGGPFDEEKLPFSIVMATGRPVDDIRHAIEWPDGRRVLISANAVPQFGEAGKITGVIATVTDITERIKAEKAIIQARDQAEAANKAKSMFLANMSHELRTPMNGIIGFSSLLSISGLNEEQYEFNEMIKSSALHLLELINDMLDFSRLEVKKIKLDNKPFDICAVVKNSRSLIYRQLKNKSMGLEYEIDERINYKVIGDQLRVKQVLLNLLTNAVKFSKEGTIKILLSQKYVKDDVACLSIAVSDQGIGIPAGRVEEIFEMFHQLDESVSKRHGGAGLGLSIVKGLVELMGGTIGVRSEVGKGSCFTVDLPLLIQAQSAAAAKESAASKILLRAESAPEILLAEDDDVCRSLIKALSKRFNWNLKIAVNGFEAVELYKNHSFDAVLMDGQMPEMNGLEAAVQIREIEASSGARVPIIALTAYAMPEDRARFIAAGMDDYITKPISDESHFFDTVMKHIKKR